MFHGLTYRRFGLNGLCIGFADRQRSDLQTCKDGGVVTLTYASGYRSIEKDRMAKRMLVAMNLTAQFELEDLENAAPLAGPEPEFSGLDTRAICRLPGSSNLVIGFDGRCPVHGIFGKNGGFAMVTYADELEHSHRAFMARRIVAAMNYVRFIPIDSLDNFMPEKAESAV